jgi:hypothetical protein
MGGNAMEDGIVEGERDPEKEKHEFLNLVRERTGWAGRVLVPFLGWISRVWGIPRSWRSPSVK